MKIFLLLLAGLGLLCGRVTAARPPNIIVIYTDDHGWADLGVQGIRKDIRTPNLDALAAGGVRATDGYVTAPQCVPSRAGLLSGRSQNRFGLESNEQFQQPGGLEGFNRSITIAERLKTVGYATGMAGKWHLGPGSEITTHGFDQVFYKNNNAAGLWNMDLDGRDLALSDQRGSGYHLDLIADFACAFIQRHAGRPFFFYLACRAPHTPLDAPPKYTARFPGEMPERRRQALAMISAIDDGVGRILAALRERQIEEHTLIFFMGDNGAPLKIHKVDSPLAGDAGGWDGSLNAPLNGEKGMLSEGGIRVPWLAYWKGTIPGGQVYRHPVISLDVAATATALAGLTVKAGELDGVNLIPHFTGDNKSAPHDALYWRWIAQSAVREGKWKLLVGGERAYLFDLEADPEEKTNLAARHPEVARRLRAKLEAWGAQLQPPGIHTRPMAATWEAYYDHYLDGKPASPPVAGGASAASAASPMAPDGWVFRNATGERIEGALRVTPASGGKQRPFMAAAGLEVNGPAKVTVSLRNATGGNVGVAWRLAGQKDFTPGATVTATLRPSPDWQEHTLTIPAMGSVIHLRLQLPGGVTELRRVTISTANGAVAKAWDFSAPPAPEPARKSRRKSK